jgi:hypothetical protein
MALTTSASTYGLTLNFQRPGSGGSRIDDVALQVYTASSCSGTFTLVGCYNTTGSTDVYEDIAATPNTTYYIRVFDSDGSGGGTTFSYCITANPRGNTPCSAIPITSFPFSYTGSTAATGITNYMTGGCNGNEAATTGTGNDMFFAVTVAANSYLTMQLTGTTAANYTELSVLSASACAGPWTCVTNGAWSGGLQAPSSPATSNTPCRTVQFATAGTYYLRVDASLSASGPFTLSVSSYTPTAGDACTNATTMSSGTPVTINSTNCVFTTGTDDPTGSLICAGTIENTNWLAFTANGSGTAIGFSVSGVSCNIGYSTGAGYYAASGQFGILTSSTNSCGGTYSTAVACQSLATGSTYSGTLPNTAGTNYYFVWDGNGGAECQYTISATNIIPLPIELISFDAKKDGQSVDLFWKTASERDNQYFTVERSSDAFTFEKIGTVNGAGTTTLQQAYYFSDKFPDTKGQNYYRLKQTDKSGTETYSAIKVVQFEKSSPSNFTIYPNPSVAGEATIRLNNFPGTTVDIVIVDAQGTVVYKSSEGLKEEIALAPHLGKGIYFIKISIGSEGIVKKFAVTE